MRQNVVHMRQNAAIGATQNSRFGVTPEKVS
jgi:hypothetical protein